MKSGIKLPLLDVFGTLMMWYFGPPVNDAPRLYVPVSSDNGCDEAKLTPTNLFKSIWNNNNNNIVIHYNSNYLYRTFKKYIQSIFIVFLKKG